MYRLFMALTVKTEGKKGPDEVIFCAEAWQVQDGQKGFLSSSVLQSSMQMAGFVPRNGSAEGKR